MVLRVHKKTGYISQDAKIRIYDHRNRPFYFKRVNNGFICFNLPKGVYYTNNAIKELAKPVVYSLPEIPQPNRYKKLPEKPFKIRFGVNPNKCSVLFMKNEIFFDNQFKQYPKGFIEFIIRHEYGHFLYGGFARGSAEYDKAEANCDTLARRLMLIEGYNPSQLDIITRLTLSSKQGLRLQCSYEQMKKA